MSFEKIDSENRVRPKGRNCILVYGYNAHENEKIKQFQQTIGIDEMLIVRESDLNKEWIELIETEVEIESDLEASHSKAIIFHSVSEEELDRFIHKFNSLGLERPLFAMMNAVTATWRVRDLIDELSAERAAMEAMKKNK